jgi:hypothetical protein
MLVLSMLLMGIGTFCVGLLPRLLPWNWKAAR